MRTLVVTAADEAFMPLLRGLILSLRQWPAAPYTAIACLDLGLGDSSRQWLSGHVQHLLEPGWDLPVAAELRQQQPHLRALTARPFLPGYFPGYDIYLWIDADAWVQERSALELLLATAARGALVAVPEVDRAYRQSAGVAEWRVSQMSAAFGAEAGQRARWDRYLNAGVFALRGDAPHWQQWANHFEDGLMASGGTMVSDQTALNHMLWSQQLAVHPLPALYNWLCHLAMPGFDGRQQKFCEPFAPSRAIGILHLSGSLSKDPQDHWDSQRRAAVARLRFPQSAPPSAFNP